jgi:hypothetical protein
MFLFFIDVEKKSTGQYFLETCNMHPWVLLVCC